MRFFFNYYGDYSDVHSFPTRRSSDLTAAVALGFTTILITWAGRAPTAGRSEEHTSELQSRGHLVCRLLLENKIVNDSVIVHRGHEAEVEENSVMRNLT